jgi:hypothetical protein
MKTLYLATGLLACLALAGCKDPYGDAAKVSLTIGQAVQAGQTEAQQLGQNGTISTAEAINISNYFQAINLGNGALQTCISTAHTNGGVPGSYTACAQAFLATANSPTNLALLQVKESTTVQSDITAISQGLITATQLVVTELGGA